MLACQSLGTGEYCSQGSNYAYELVHGPQEFAGIGISLVSTVVLASGPWQVVGPDGGDARSLAYDARNPDHMLLGTSTGQLFVSNDGGHRLGAFRALGRR